MKRLATHEQEAIVSIPEVIRIAVVGIEPQLAIIVPLNVEHVEVAVRVGCVQKTILTTTPRILLRLYLIRHYNARALCTKYLHFLKFAYTLRLKP